MPRDIHSASPEEGVKCVARSPLTAVRVIQEHVHGHEEPRKEEGCTLEALRVDLRGVIGDHPLTAGG
jgi:hypothetical protein